MPTTVASSMAMPEPSTVAAMTQRPRPLERARGSGTAAAGVGPPVWDTSLIEGAVFAVGETVEARMVRTHAVTRTVVPPPATRPRRNMGPSLFLGRPDAGGGPVRARHFKILTARATTRIPTTRETADSAIIMSFAQVLTADTSVGLKAAAVANAKWK